MGPGWIQVAAVSHRWREVALQTPRLWAKITLDFPLHAAEWLARSKSAPLQLDARLPSSLSSPTLSIVKSALSIGTRLLDLHLTYENIESLLHVLPDTTISTSAPALEKLQLSWVGRDRQDTSSNVPQIWHDMPSLRAIKLYGTLIPCNLLILPRLTTFVFTGSNAMRGADISWLVRLLGSTPALVYLEVFSLSNKSPNDLQPSMRVSLPKLNALRVKSDDLVGLRLYDWVELPDTARISHTILNIEAQPDFSFPGLQSACSRFPIGPGAPLIRKTQLSVDLDESIEIQLSPTNSYFAHDANFRIVLPSPAEVNNHDTVYAQILQALPLQQTETLLLERFGHHSTQYLQRVFPSLTHLQTLHLTACTASLLQNLLKAPNTDDLPMPALKNLVMNRCAFNHAWSVRDDHFYAAMVNVLEERNAEDAPLDALIIQGCDISRAVVEDLENHVDSLEWDDYEIEKLPHEDEDYYDLYGDDDYDDYQNPYDGEDDPGYFYFPYR
ncbi:hypothetical protein ONZ45_g6709 [Pleurotus djamor]|nr:hypothetical protein ONZ45_g6709 [Pleurotus djamor]